MIVMFGQFYTIWQMGNVVDINTLSPEELYQYRLKTLCNTLYMYFAGLDQSLEIDISFLTEDDIAALNVYLTSKDAHYTRNENIITISR